MKRYIRFAEYAAPTKVELLSLTCTNCGGTLDEDRICKYCGTHFVLSNIKEQEYFPSF